MREYRIIDDKVSDAQKKLNQWRHDYRIIIEAMHTYQFDGNTYIVILLFRELII